MDAQEKQLETLDKELDDSARYLTITPTGYLYGGWSKAEWVLFLEEVFIDQLREEGVDDLMSN